MRENNLRNLAYVGDAIWELFVRERTTLLTDCSPKLHRLTTEKVNAIYQAELCNLILDDLTKEEMKIFRRARNLSIPVARRQIQNEYRHATAFEAMIGWWYFYDKIKLEQILKKLEAYMEF